MVLNGRRKQKRRAITKVIPIDVPSDARKAVSCIYLLLVSGQVPHLSIVVRFCTKVLHASSSKQYSEIIVMALRVSCSIPARGKDPTEA